MKVKLEANGTSEYQRIPLERMSKTDKIPNRELDEKHVASLQTSIAKSGLDTPLTIWGGTKPGTKMKMKGVEVPAAFLVAGFHRREAIKAIRNENPERFDILFKEGVPCVVKFGELKDILLLQLRENVDRKDPSAEEILPFLRRLRTEFKMEQKEIARNLGKSTAWVSVILDIENTLGDEATEEVSKGGVSLREARDVAKSIKKERSEGKTPDVKAKVAKMKAESAERKSKGKKRREKRTSIGVLFKRYRALPQTGIGARVRILEEMIEYAIGEADEPPSEVAEEAEEKPKKSKK